MKTTSNGWKVVDEAAGVLMYEYTFRKGSTSNAMTARMADGSLLVVSAPCRVSDGVFKDLEAFGGVSALVANNSFHHMGMPEWSKAFPKAKLYANEAAASRIRKKHDALPAFEGTEALASRLAPGVRVHSVPGISNGELWLQSGPIWYVSDGFFNFTRIPGGLFGLVFKWTESGPGFRLNGMQNLLFVRDKPAYKRWMLAQLDEALPKTVVPSHGAIEHDASVGTQMRSLIEERL